VRGTTATVALLCALTLAGCAEDPAEPDVLDLGPLVVDTGPSRCIDGLGLTEASVGGVARNSDDKPLTIDGVEVSGARNLRLVDAHLFRLHGPRREVPVVDATIEGTKEGPADRGLGLVFDVTDPTKAASYDSVSVEYHNVDGRFRAVDRTTMTITTPCP
jgi:hypothetical protein